MTPSSSTLSPQRASTVEAEMREFFRAALSFASVSGQEGDFSRFVAEWGQGHGLRADLWETDDAAVAAETEFDRHISLAGRPTLVLELPGEPDLPSLLLNAHADVVSPGDRTAWRHDPWSGDFADGRFYGRGACDDKGPLVSALWAMLRLAERPARRGNVMLELVPGEEDCVGLGTWASLRRGWNADAVVVLEPTESLPRCASRGGCRFEIEILGRSVHGTVKWLGRDAIAAATSVLAALNDIEAAIADEEADELFASYPISRPITVDSIHGGQWQGMVCDRCQIAGYFELLPRDDVGQWQRRLASELLRRASDRGISADQIRIRFVEQYAGHRLASDHSLCRCATAAVAQCGGPAPLAWSAFNSGCEAGLRAGRHATPTLVWGPGSLAQAHAVDEYVAWEDVCKVGEMLAALTDAWTAK